VTAAVRRSRRKDKPPPAHLPYVEALGEELAVRFLLAFGGSTVHLSKNPRAGMVARTIGVEAAMRLAAAIGGGDVKPPIAKRWIAGQLLRCGHSIAMIARRLHADEATVRKWLGPAPVERRQLSLFP